MTHYYRLIVVLAGLLALSSGHLASQPLARTAKNVISLELLGNGGFVSINYERFVTDQLALRCGFGYSPLLPVIDSWSFWIPVTVSYLFFDDSHHLETGFGGTLGFGPQIIPAATFILGYRYCPPDGGFNFKLAVTPWVIFFKDKGAYNLPLAGIDFGHGF